eukprot:Platyproteum_vivax@DN7443_c0_g1_i9.p1
MCLSQRNLSRNSRPKEKILQRVIRKLLPTDPKMKKHHFVLEYEKASTEQFSDENQKTTDNVVYGTINLSKKNEIQDNVVGLEKIRLQYKDYANPNMISITYEERDPVPIVAYIGEKAIEFLHKYKAEQSSGHGSANALQ